MPHDWSRLFLPGDFRWHLGLQAGDARSFFAPTEEQAALLTERAHWLGEAPEEYAALAPDGAPLLAEALALARSWGASVAEDSVGGLGRAWEPDFVLLSCGEGGLIVEGGAVCFPTAWALRDKVGRSLFETHGPVPQLNTQLAVRIDTALRKLAPGAAWERDNWGLARGAELNRHPRRQLPRLDAAVTPDEVWLRIEQQLLLKLPQTGGVLFGIRITTVPLRELPAVPAATDGLRRALESMPEDAAAYKGLTTARPTIIGWLKAAAAERRIPPLAGERE